MREADFENSDSNLRGLKTVKYINIPADELNAETN